MPLSLKPLLLFAVMSLVLCLSPKETQAANPSLYEVGTDPGVGFNLISWANFGSSGASTWENAVQSIYDAGFREVSISPVRFVTLGTGSIATTSAKGPELIHIAAGISKAKSLGMRVTVNPFVEPTNFSMWRGFYNPVPGSGESNTFWNDYQQYLVDVAQVAQANGADAMTVGTELKAITRNSGNNASWNSVISAVDSQFGGSLGYAANWDNYQNANLTSTIWENTAIDFLGIDAYFQGMLSNSQSNNSGSYPNPTFINQVETAWNNKLDNEILPFAATRQAGSGLPVEFTEIGYLPYNRTAVTPQNSSGAIDRDEQNMAYEGFMRALDGRLGTVTSAQIWNWGMPGTGSNLWDMGISGSQPHANNVQSTQWLSDFVSNPVASEDADFDGDGDIDGQDFLAWQRGFGILSGAGTTQGDANGDGAVNEADLAIWNSQYGLPAAISTSRAIPEPTTTGLLVLASLVLGSRRMSW